MLLDDEDDAESTEVFPDGEELEVTGAVLERSGTAEVPKVRG
jgi:hypothetical protein